MASPYDQSLLAAAPAATKAQLQDGYNPDLLLEKPAAPTPPTNHSRADLEAAPPPIATKAPFLSTTKGRIIVAVALVVVVAAVVGGAVGGSRKSKNNSAVVQSGGSSANETVTMSISQMTITGPTSTSTSAAGTPSTATTGSGPGVTSGGGVGVGGAPTTTTNPLEMPTPKGPVRPITTEDPQTTIGQQMQIVQGQGVSF